MDLQSFIFEQKPTRKQLLDYKSTVEKRFKVCVYRNHSFEFVENTISAYLDYAGIGVDFVYSDYDDSLTFLSIPDDSDMIILWLDISRYKNENVSDFINTRLKYLSEIFAKPILFVPFGKDIVIDNKYVVIYSMEDIQKELGNKMVDLRMEPFTGTKMSASAVSMAARQLGLVYIPALLMPSLKAVVVDLDNTLYKGVLGEDRFDGIELTDGHKLLQEKLHQLSQQGYFICVASKNDERDVLELFEKRNDFPLKKEDLSKLCVSWESKASSIGEIAAYLNIGVDSILFIDDNYGEINSVCVQFPSIHTIRAYDDAELTLKVLESFPRMKKFGEQREDNLRKNDIIANEKRRILKETLSGDEYIKSLGMKLTYSVDCNENASRVAELANKTNQFIFNYKRYTLSEIEEMIKSDNACVISISLSDNLSDSGIIGVCCAKSIDNIVKIEECYVSCRALGRGIDECIVLGAIKIACDKFSCNKVNVCFKKGERNLPAENFVTKNFGSAEKIEVNGFSYDFPDNIIDINIKE